MSVIFGFVPLPWASEKACADVGIDIFFPGDGEAVQNYAIGRLICERCPVQMECLSHALDTREEYGMWGGFTPQERDRMLSRRGTIPAFDGERRHGTPSGYKVGCRCDECRSAASARRMQVRRRKIDNERRSA